MKKKSALFLLLIGGTMLSGCIGNPKLEEDTIGEIISEKDPVYDYLQGYVDNVSLVKEKDDGDSKTVWVKTTTEFDNFTYEGSYVIDCGLYSKNGNKEWDVNNFQIDYEDIRFIPTQYDYNHYDFIYRDYGYDNVNATSAKEIFEILADDINCLYKPEIQKKLLGTDSAEYLVYPSFDGDYHIVPGSSRSSYDYILKNIAIYSNTSWKCRQQERANKISTSSATNIHYKQT